MGVAVEDMQETVSAGAADQILINDSLFFRVVKRVFDITLSAVGLVCLLLPMVMIAVIIRLESTGPAIYKQERLGYKRIPFTLYKFRSMYIDAEANGPQWAEKDDDRVTKVGAFLRKTRLDELPQLWNIFVGEMSFVGPRPEREYFYNIFEEYIPDFGKRMLVKPGLTGWAQINGGYDLGPEEKIVYDLEYLQKRSLGMDLKCIIKTVKLVFTHEGAR